MNKSVFKFLPNHRFKLNAFDTTDPRSESSCLLAIRVDSLPVGVRAVKNVACLSSLKSSLYNLLSINYGNH